MPRNGSNIFSKPAGTTAVANTTIESAKYNATIDDLVADANTPRPVVAGGTGANSAAAARTALGLAIGTDVQAYDADLAAIASLGYTSGAYLLKKTAAGTFSLIALTAAGEALLDDANAAAQLTTLGIGGDVPAIEALGGTGIAVRTAADTWAQRQIVSADGSVTIANPAGVAGNIDLSANGIFFRLDSAHAGANGTSLQNFFPQAVTLEASTVYEYEFWIGATKTAGTTDHTFAVGFGGTHTRNNTFRHLLTSGQNNAAKSATVLTFTGFSAAATNVVVTNYTSANATFWHREFGSFSVDTAGTWFPAYQLSAAPGGAWSTAAGSYVRLRSLGAAGANNSQGAWA